MINELQRPIDTFISIERDTFREQTYSYKRLTNSEVLLSQEIFIELGLS